MEIVLIIFMLALCFVSISASRGNVPYIFGYKVLKVVSNSMQPAISDRSCIIIKKVAEEEIKTGDIITFVSEDPQIQGFYNTHRVFEIRVDEATGEKEFITRGDANLSEDVYPVRYAQIVGRYVCDMPFGKAIFSCTVFLSNQLNYFLVVIFPLMLCFLSYFRDLLKAIFGKEEEEE